MTCHTRLKHKYNINDYYLIGTHFNEEQGKLFIIEVDSKNNSLKSTFLGYCSLPSCLVYLDNNFVFVGKY